MAFKPFEKKKSKTRGGTPPKFGKGKPGKAGKQSKLRRY